MRQLIGVALPIALAACAAAPADHAPAPAALHESAADKSVVPGTIGAVVSRAEGGVRVQALAADGPAARAGLQVGDLVVRCGGKTVATTRQFNQQVLATRPGESLHLDVRRDARTVSVQVDVMQLRTALRL